MIIINNPIATTFEGLADALREGREGLFDLRRAAPREIRALTANGSGPEAFPTELSAFIDTGKMLNLVETFAGENSAAVVGCFTTAPAAPTAVAPGSTGTAEDSTGVYAAKSLTLSAYPLGLRVSRGAMLQEGFPEKLRSVLLASVGAAIDRIILTENGSAANSLGVFTASMDGVPTSQDINSAASGLPKLVDLLALAEKILTGTIEGPGTAVVMRPETFINALKDSTAGYAEIKAELTRRSLLGLPVIVSTHCPSGSTAGTYTAAGGNFRHYALALAPEIYFDEFHSVGSDNIHVRATLYARGAPLIGGSFWRLKAV